MPDDAPKSDPPRIVRGACPHDCPDTCALETTVVGGRAVAIRGAPAHPTTRGTLCTKVAHYLDRTYSPERVLHPMKRVGPKGAGQFERIGWDEALDVIAGRFRAIAASPAGPEAILPYSYAGTMGVLQWSSMDRRFFNRLGASLLDRTICATAGRAGISYSIGGALGTEFERFADARLILLWGTNAVVSNLHLWARCQEAKRQGAMLVAIDPVRTVTAEKCGWHLAPLPGTDGALALGMMHVLIRDGLLDRDYIERYTLGFEALAQRVADYPPERVARITGLGAADVNELARLYGTIRPAAIRMNYGMTRHAGGGMAARNVACLPALVGAWRDPAGGLLLSSSQTFPLDTAALERPDLRPNQPRTLNMSPIGNVLLAAVPPVQAIYVYNSNPVAVAPDSRRVVAGFSRPDLFCVVHEIFLTDTTDYADIVLPATTQLEQTDLHNSYGHVHLLANQPAIAPLGEAKPNTEVFRLLAARMGFTEPCFRESDDEIAESALLAGDSRRAGIDWAGLKERGWQRLALPEDYAPFGRGQFLTPSGKCEFWSDRLSRMGIDPLPTYHPPRESPDSDPGLAARYPLAFLSPPARNFLNSSFANLADFVAAEKTPWLELHSTDARQRGIATGDRVRAWNDRGSLELTARVNDRPRAGVVVAPSLWWRKLSPDGKNANELTGQGLTDLGGGAVFYDTLVEVERIGTKSA